MFILFVPATLGVGLVYADQCGAKLTGPVLPANFMGSDVLVQIPVSLTCSTGGQAYAGATATDTSTGAVVLTQGGVLDPVGQNAYSGSVTLRFPSSASQGHEIQITALIYSYDSANGLGSHLTTATETWQANFGLPNSTAQDKNTSSSCNASTDGACCPYGAGYSNLYCPGYVNNGAGCLYPEGTPFYEMPGTCPSSTPPPSCPYNYYYINGYCYSFYQEQLPLCSQSTSRLILCFPSPNGQRYCYQVNVGVYTCYPYANSPPYYYPYANSQIYYYPCYPTGNSQIYYCLQSR